MSQELAQLGTAVQEQPTPTYSLVISGLSPALVEIQKPFGSFWQRERDHHQTHNTYEKQTGRHTENKIQLHLISNSNTSSHQECPLGINICQHLMSQSTMWAINSSQLVSSSPGNVLHLTHNCSITPTLLGPAALLWYPISNSYVWPATN